MLKGRLTISVVLLLMTSLSSVASLVFSPGLMDTYVVVGKPFWWTCSVLRTEGSTGLTFVWRFQDGDMSSTDQTRIAYDNGTLYFPQVLSSHLGRYTCIAPDNQGPIESSAWLRRAYIARDVTISPTQQSVPAGGTVVIECRVDARPFPDIGWNKDGQRILKTSRIQITDVNSGHSMLQISNSTYADAGSYTCTVSHVSIPEPLTSPTAVVSVYGPPLLTSTPQNQSVPIGYNAAFHCKVISQPQSQVSWYYQTNESSAQTPLSTSPPSILIDVLTGALMLYNVHKINSGIFTCSWTNEYGTIAASATLTVGGQPQAPSFLIRPEDTTVVEGDDVVLNCSGQGNPTPTVDWLFPTSEMVTLASDGTTTTTSDDIIIGKDRSLTVKNVKRRNMAEYICVLNNSEGSAESRAFLNVMFKPYLISQQLDTFVTEGSSFTLSCDVAGNPDPTVSWSLPGKPDEQLTVDNSGTNSGKNEIVLESGELKVNTAGRANQGVYTCIASNEVGSINMSFTVAVIGAPHFSVIPMSQGVIEGDNVSLSCQVDTYPGVSVEWYYKYMIDPAIQSTDIVQLKQSLAQSSLPTEDMSVVDINLDPRYSFVNDTSLQILNVEENDAGLYICMASSEKGSAFEPAILRVITYPHFQTVPVDTMAFLGSSVMLHCFAIGIPVPTQRWLFNEGKLTLNSRMKQFINGTLLIQNIEESDFGLYTCLGTNQAGQRSASALLMQSTLPYFVTQPSNLTASKGFNVEFVCRGAGSSSFEVLWYLSNANGDALTLLGQTVVSHSADPSVTDTNTAGISRSRVRVTPEGHLVMECVDPSDSSWYKCTLQNTEGSISSNPVFLTVIYTPRDMAVSTPEKVYAANGATLTCVASGFSLPVITWITPERVELIGEYFNDMLLATEQSTDFVKSILTIRIIQPRRDGGQWTCKACNDAGCRLARGYLTIEGRAEVRQIISEESDTEVSIYCQTTGIPEPNITYSTRGLPITNAVDGHRVENKILFIEKDKVNSQYSCLVENLFGSTPVLFLTPSSVLILNATAASFSAVVNLQHKAIIPSLLPNKVLLQFKTPESTLWQDQTFFLSQYIDEYLQAEKGALQGNDSTDISCHNGDETPIVKRDVDGATTSSENVDVSLQSDGINFIYSIQVQLENLSPNTVYDIRAAMVNALGTGPFSFERRITTLAAAPSPVSNVVVNVSNRTASISWTNPDPLNGRPEDTSITVKLLDADSNTINEAMFSVLDTPQITFPSLIPGDYAVQISASNSQTNITSEHVTVKFQVENEPPQYIPEISGIRALNSNIIQVTWTLPPTSVIPPVTGFLVAISQVVTDANTVDLLQVFEVSNASISSKTIRNLQERTEYSVRVASKNTAGKGPFSEPKTVKTPYSEFSNGALNDSSPGYNISWKMLAIIITCICSALIILTVVVIATHQVKLARSKSVDVTPYPEENNNPGPMVSSIEESPKRDDTNTNAERVARVADGYTNDGFMMY